MNSIHLLSESIVSVPASLQGWMQVATNAGFAGLVWYLLAIVIPRMQERFDEHSDKQQKQFLEETERLRKSHEFVIQQMIEQHERQQERLITVLSQNTT